MTSDKPFSNNTTAHERLETLLNDRNVLRPKKDTFQSRAESEANEIQGRFAAHEKQTVVGSEAATKYPRQPEGSFSNQSAMVGDEPPYDGDLSAPIVGENFEVAASIAALEAVAPAPEASGHLRQDDASGAVSAEGERDPSETSRQDFPPAPSQVPLRSPNQTTKGRR